MEFADVVDAELNGLEDTCINQLEGRIELCRRNLEIGFRYIGLVEFAAEACQCLVALGADRFEDRRDLFDEARYVGFRTAQQGGLLFGVQLRIFVERH